MLRPMRGTGIGCELELGIAARRSVGGAGPPPTDFPGSSQPSRLQICGTIGACLDFNHREPRTDVGLLCAVRE